MINKQNFCNKIFLWKKIGAGIIIFISVLVFMALFSASVKGDSSNEIVLNFSFTEPVITQWNVLNTTYHNVTMNEIGDIGDTGVPVLPVKQLSILLPQKGIVKSMNVTFSNNVSLGYGYNVTPGGLLEEQEDPYNESLFNSSRPYPTELVKNLGIGYFRGYTILTCFLYPVHYINDTGEIYYYENMTLNITTNNTGSVSKFFRGLERDEILMKQLVDDYSMNYTYDTLLDVSADSTIVHPSQQYDFVIITKEEFVNANRPFGIRGLGWRTFQDLADNKTSMGIKTNITTIESIVSDPAYYGTGYWGDGDDFFNDTQCRIRNFIKHAQRIWGADYFLLGGDDDNWLSQEILPARKLWCINPKQNFFNPEILKTFEIPSDLYYAHIHGSFNGNKDDIWGEPWDGNISGDFEDPPDRLPDLDKDGYYAEADLQQYKTDFEVGLFTPPLNLSGCSSITLKFKSNYKTNSNDHPKVIVYSNESGNLTNKTEKELSDGSYSPELDFDIDGFQNKEEVYIEFYYKKSYLVLFYNLSWNIDKVLVYETINENNIFLLEDFENPWVENEYGDIVPGANWTMKRYSQTLGKWTREHYRDDVDLIGDVFIGRAPVGNPREVSNFVFKTLKYEKEIPARDPALKTLLLVGGLLHRYGDDWDYWDWGEDYCDLVKEYILHINEVTKVTDEKGLWGIVDYYTKRQLRQNLCKNFHLIFNMDHGEWNSIIRDDGLPRFSNFDALRLSNKNPYFWCSGSCLTGNFSMEDSLVEYLTVKTKQGAFAAIMFSAPSWNVPIDKVEGLLLEECFYKSLFTIDPATGKYHLIGKALILSKNKAKEVIKSSKYYDDEERVNVYGYNLIGDPTVSIKIPVNDNHPYNPNKPDISSQNGNWYTFYTHSHDPEGDYISYKWKWVWEGHGEYTSSWSKRYYSSGQDVYKLMWLPPGSHLISARAKDIYDEVSIEWSQPKLVVVPFGSNIQMDTTTTILGEELQFYGQASEGTEPYTTWYYDFGDGNYSNEQNTSHTYSNLGSYNVTLNVTDSQNITSNITKVVNIVILKSDFDCSPSCGIAYETINFNDVSDGYHNLVNWSWDFGDGNTSYNMNPGHQYADEGVYNVSLIVTDDQSNINTSYQTIYIDSGDPVVTSCSTDVDKTGYGYNLTIIANLTDDISGIKTAAVNITYPDSSSGNYTMNNTFGNIYEYVFSDTWQLGEYSYIVWVVDNVNNINCSSEHSFVVSRIYGCNKVGGLNQTIWDTITGSVFIVNEKGVADNVSVYLDPGNASSDYHYTCVIYRNNDSVLVGVSEEKNITGGKGWQMFNFSVPKPVLLNDTEYVIGCWSDNDSVSMYYADVDESEEFYDDGISTLQGCYFEGCYNYTPDPIWFDFEDRKYSIYCSYSPDNTKPVITNVSDNPSTVGFGFNVTITANVVDNQSGVENVIVNITYPNSTTGNFTMNNTGNDTYQYVFSDTWLVGQYNYTIWTVDYIGNSNTSTGHSFNVSAQATISVCTIKDVYGDNETINLTDPPGDPTLIGYELMDNGIVLRIWNNYDSYYFNTTSGIQLTNHYNEYWSHNVLMVGYYNNNQWHLIYRTDELSGFNKNIESDNETFVNATLWKDLTYQGYDFRLAIRYHLGVDDKELTIIPYIKNLGQAIPYTLGFAWEINDIQVDMTPSGDYLEVNGTTYYLNQSLDETYKDMNQSCFYIREDFSSDRSESLYLCWNDSLDYLVKVKSREGQYNAPVTLGIKIGTLGVGQEKYTTLLWHDSSQITYYFNSYNAGETWATNPSYMVDGSTSTYASTTVNGDVELCNGNTCSGLYFGEIIKVELRAYGKYTGTQRDIILRPVFGGTTDGRNYIYLTTTTPNWSQWFDITTDPSFTPPWSWSKVDNLDCDVEAESGFGVFTLYCSKVEIRVTYIPNNNPVISNPYPADGSTGISIAPLLNITVSDPEGNSMNITWLSNRSGSWQVFGTNNSVSNGTYHQIMSNASVNGQWWYWKVNVTDGINYTESNVYKFYTGYQSKINNTGSYHFKGYLLIQVQYYNESSQSWVVADDTINETSPRTVLWADPGGTPGQNILSLDTIFNGLVNTQYLSGNGTYRVYACFRDPYGNVLVCNDDSLMEATYEFTINL